MTALTAIGAGVVSLICYAMALGITHMVSIDNDWGGDAFVIGALEAVAIGLLLLNKFGG